MNLQERIDLMVKLGNELKRNDPDWQEAKLKAYQNNPWFTTAFIDIATENIIENFLRKDHLDQWVKHYHLDDNLASKNVGVIMAGNIPLVGFHDFLSVFISGHRQTIKLSSKDEILMNFILKKLAGWNNDIENRIALAELLKGCDAYIATGSNNSARYFDQYFARYPHIIRRNKTSVGILTGNETVQELEKLSDDIHLFFGLGCRNVTKLFVPRGYDFVPLIRSFDKYSYFMDQHKYKNNYDYQLSILLLNHCYYMTNGNTLLVENPANYSPISVLNYEFYEPGEEPAIPITQQGEIQCIIGKNHFPFGKAQSPGLFNYADQVDTQQFLLYL